MKNTLIQNISRYISLSEEEAHIIEKFWIERSFEKGEYLLRNGETCRYDTYVVSGSVKTYFINDKTERKRFYFLLSMTGGPRILRVSPNRNLRCITFRL